VNIQSLRTIVKGMARRQKPSLETVLPLLLAGVKGASWEAQLLAILIKILKAEKAK